MDPMQPCDAVRCRGDEYGKDALSQIAVTRTYNYSEAVHLVKLEPKHFVEFLIKLTACSLLNFPCHLLSTR